MQHIKSLFGRAPASPKTALAPTPLLELEPFLENVWQNDFSLLCKSNSNSCPSQVAIVIFLWQKQKNLLQ
jgi:DNA phosphorothioation-dependent restriction protein DptG